MKIHQIVNAIPSFNKLASSNLKLPDAYRLKKFLDSMETDIEFFNTQKENLALKYGEGENFVVPVDKRLVAAKEMKELMDLEVDTKYEILKLPLSDNIELSAEDVKFLMPFVEFESR